MEKATRVEKVTLVLFVLVALVVWGLIGAACWTVVVKGPPSFP
jgi:cell division protein FtsL